MCWCTLLTLDDLEIEVDVWAVKRSHDADDTSGGESDGVSEHQHHLSVPEKHRRRGAYHHPRRPITNNPLALIKSCVAVKVEEAATCGYPRIWCFES